MVLLYYSNEFNKLSLHFSSFNILPTVLKRTIFILLVNFASTLNDRLNRIT